MGIKFLCPNGHKLNVKSFLAGKRGICPHCGIGVDIPEESTRASRKNGKAAKSAGPAVPVPRPVPAAVPAGAMVATTAASPVAVPSVATTQATVNLQNSPPASTAVAAPLAQMPAAPTRNVATPIGSPAAMPAPAAVATVATPIAAAVATSVAALPPDPIAEAPNSVWYVRPPSGGQFGPAKGDIMRKWIAEGRVSADSLVWREGWPDWKTAGPVFPTLARTPPAAPAAPAAAALPANPLSQPLPSTSVAKPRRAAPKNSNALAVAVVVLLGLISVILIAVFAYVVINGNLNGPKKNDSSQIHRVLPLDKRGLVLDSRAGGPSLGRG